MTQRLQTMARPGEADGAGWFNEPLAEGPQVFSSPQVHSGKCSCGAGATTRRLPSFELLITIESMHAFNAVAATPLIDTPAMQWELAVLAACAGAASPPSLAAGPQKRKVLPPPGCAAKLLHPAPGPQKHHTTRFPEVELRRSETLRFAFTEIDFTYPYATAGVMSEHDMAVMSTHFRLWPAMLKIGIVINLIHCWHNEGYQYGCSIGKYTKLVCVLVPARGKPPFGQLYCSARYRVAPQAAPAERFNVFVCRPWPAIFKVDMASILSQRWHTESFMRRYPADTFTNWCAWCQPQGCRRFPASSHGREQYALASRAAPADRLTA